MGTRTSSSPQRRSSSLDPPRVLAFYKDAWDDSGTVIGWQTLAWGLVLGDGSAISIPVEPPVQVTLWQSVDDAVMGLDAYVDRVDPRRTIDDGRDVPPLPRPSTVPPPSAVDGAAAHMACPDDPTADGRDRPLGTLKRARQAPLSGSAA